MWGTGPVLVVAPHPDDETMGAGGTMARLAAQGRDIYVVIVTYGDPKIFPDYSLEQARREALEAHEILGVRKTFFLEGLPAALLDTVPQSTLNAVLGKVMDQIEPDLLFVPFLGDMHLDHRKVAEGALVGARPDGKAWPTAILAYETVSETRWFAPPVTPGFLPNVYVDISAFIEAKLAASSCFQSQLKEPPNERSLEALRAQALHRGATVGLNAAEAFVMIRSRFA